MTLKREDIIEKFNDNILGKIEIKEVMSEDSVVSNSLLTPFSYKLKKSKSDSDLYSLNRRINTFGSILSVESVNSPKKEKQIYIINGDYKCIICESLIPIKHNFISFTCSKCLKYYIKPLTKFIIK